MYGRYFFAYNESGMNIMSTILRWKNQWLRCPAFAVTSFAIKNLKYKFFSYLTYSLEFLNFYGVNQKHRLSGQRKIGHG